MDTINTEINIMMRSLGETQPNLVEIPLHSPLVDWRVEDEEFHVQSVNFSPKMMLWCYDAFGLTHCWKHFSTG